MISDEQLSTMPLAELRELYGKIGARIEALLSEEKASTIRKVRELMETYGLGPKDIFGRSSGYDFPVQDRRTQPRKVKPKYRDPVTGNQWTGRGKPPRWIEGKNREDYLINRS